MKATKNILLAIAFSFTALGLMTVSAQDEDTKEKSECCGKEKCCKDKDKCDKDKKDCDKKKCDKDKKDCKGKSKCSDKKEDSTDAGE